MRRRYVTFCSPGTLVSEMTTRECEWNTRKATLLAQEIVERHGAKPFGFVFSERVTAAPVSDGEGGTLDVKEREVERTGMHFLGGEVVTYDAIEARAYRGERILLSNMRCNGYPLVVENRNSYLSTHPFEERDVIVGEDGEVTVRGTDPALADYRTAKLAQWKKDGP